MVAQAFTSHEHENGSVLTALSSGDWTHRVDEAIDLKTGLPQLPVRTRRQVLRFAFEGEGPAKVGGRYPDPQALAAEIAERIDDPSAAAMLSKELREVRACRSLATAMSGKRSRPPLLTRVDTRLEGRACARCTRQLRLGQEVFFDRDWGAAWHVAGGCHG